MYSVVLKHVPNNINFITSPVHLSGRRLFFPGTFKIKKLDLQREGFNPHVIEDRMFFYDVVKGAYRRLDACLYEDIVEMRCRL